MMDMTHAEIDTFLQGVHLARVATVRPDGRPHVVPVWYLWLDGTFYFETGRTAVKANNLRANPQLAVTVDVSEGGLRLRHVILEGQVTLIEERSQVQPLTERIYSRYVGIEGLQTPAVQKMLNGDIIIVQLKPARFVTWDNLSPAKLAPL
jgi:PPOX class probable F420-dependent enzyme